jgi:hypothetical protein
MGVITIGPMAARRWRSRRYCIVQGPKGDEASQAIEAMHHFARDHVASGEHVFLYCKLEDNVSDCLNKALPRPMLQVGLAGLGMLRV